MTPLLDRQRERFLADPNDAQAFQALEEELFLAGDWTATGLPATIESAVLSGHTAARLVEGSRR